MPQSSALLINILNSWVEGQQPTHNQIQQLAEVMLADENQVIAFDITPDKVIEKIQERSHLFQSVYPTLFKFYTQPHILETLWNLWLPLAIKLAEYRRQLKHPFIQGILGGQGTGKSTLTAILTLILAQLNYRAINISLDDLYKTYSERVKLTEQDPRLIWRGPPGTHDIQLGLEVLERLRQPQQQSILIPRFDKSAWNGAGDRTNPEIVESVDIVLFEGWFVGAQPIDPDLFDRAPPPILTPGDRLFARDMNERLKDYLPLWEKLDSLIVLYPLDYRFSKQWRLQAEHQMIASGKPGMDDRTINQFVDYFWKALHPELFIRPLTNNSDFVDLVIGINQNHSVVEIYRPMNNNSKN